MAWHITGQSTEFCNCKLLCPCWLGPEGEPDEGWCGATFAFDVKEGSSDGVNLGGTKTVFVAEWPGNFFAGDGTARLYIDEAASPDQYRELEGIFSGKKGGNLEPLWDATIAKWLPTKTESIGIQWGDPTHVTMGDDCQVTLTPLKDSAGRRTKVTGAAAQAAFGFESMDLASSRGGRWSDPDLRSWDTDDGTLHEFDWSG
jgi:hypothetical protein